MSATVTATASDRSDFRTVMVGGTQIGVLTAVAVVAFLIVSRQVPAGMLQRALEALVVLAAGTAVSFLPALLTQARHVEGRAAAVPGIPLDLGRHRRREYMVVPADLVDARHVPRLDRRHRQRAAGGPRRDLAPTRRDAGAGRRGRSGGRGAGRPARPRARPSG